MKLLTCTISLPWTTPFSILERIDVGETTYQVEITISGLTFSILERIDVGETARGGVFPVPDVPFSILERIDVGETTRCAALAAIPAVHFQYPRTDRRG